MSVRVGDEIVAGSSGDVYTKTQVDALIAAVVAQTTEKPGMIKPFAGTTIPTGYLLCDGSAVSRTTYADLFAAIGTTYGSGDGNSTFNLPSLMDKLPWKSIMGSPGQSNKGILPKIEGHFTLFATYGGGGSSGALNASWNGSTRSPNNVSGTGDMRVTFAASRSSSAYTGLTDDVVPSVLFVGGYIIKY
jgi:hypothetical protein